MATGGRVVEWRDGQWTELRAGSELIGMWHALHSSSMTARMPGWSITSRRTPACQYGSRAELAMIDPRHDVPIDMSSPLGVTRPL